MAQLPAGSVSSGIQLFPNRQHLNDSLEGKGGTLVASPEGFFVKSTKGPLREGELERADGWARGIVESKK